MPSRPTLRPYRTSPSAYGPTQERFCNVDLDIAAPLDLSPLLRALEPKLDVLHHRISARRSFITAELNGQQRSASTAILRFAAIVRGLLGKPRALWKKCTCRSLNIGYDAASRFPALVDVVSLDALRAAVSIDADIAITIYPPDESSMPRVGSSQRRGCNVR